MKATRTKKGNIKLVMSETEAFGHDAEDVHDALDELFNLEARLEAASLQAELNGEPEFAWHIASDDEIWPEPPPF